LPSATDQLRLTTARSGVFAAKNDLSAPEGDSVTSVAVESPRMATTKRPLVLSASFLSLSPSPVMRGLRLVLARGYRTRRERASSDRTLRVRLHALRRLDPLSEEPGGGVEANLFGLVRQREAAEDGPVRFALERVHVLVRVHHLPLATAARMP